MKDSATQSLGYWGLKQSNLCFHEDWSKLLDKRKQAILQWYQNSSHISWY